MKERVPISLKLPKLLLDRIDDVWRNSEEYTGRTHFIEKACAYYLSCEKCPECGNLNSIGSCTCSQCGAELSGFKMALDNVIGEIQIYNQFNEHIFSRKQAYDDLNSKIEWLLDQLPADKRPYVDNILSENHSNGNKLIENIVSYQEFYNAYSNPDIFSSAENFLGKKLSEYYDSQMLELLENHTDDIVTKSKFDSYLLRQYAQVTYDYYKAKSLVENQESVHANELKEYYQRLFSGRLILQSLVNNVDVSLSSLKSVEKMIMFLIQQPNP